MDKDYITKILTTVKNSHKKNTITLNNIENLLMLGNSEPLIGDLLHQFINDISSEAQYARNLPANLGLSKDVYRIEDSEYAMKIEETGRGYKFVLPDLLPKRCKEYSGERNLTRHNYASALQKYKQAVGFKPIGGRVNIIVTNFYINNTMMIDNDNVDVKAIIDYIASYILVDDNPEMCDLTVRGRIGEDNHSEIEVSLVEE